MPLSPIPAVPLCIFNLCFKWLLRVGKYRPRSLFSWPLGEESGGMPFLRLGYDQLLVLGIIPVAIGYSRIST
jgi:hypothetical protein